MTKPMIHTAGDAGTIDVGRSTISRIFVSPETTEEQRHLLRTSVTAIYEDWYRLHATPEVCALLDTWRRKHELGGANENHR